MLTGKVNFFAVAVHEFGHSVGLSHSSVQGAIMYPYYQNMGNNLTLSSDDIYGIQAIYGKLATKKKFKFIPLLIINMI